MRMAELHTGASCRIFLGVLFLLIAGWHLATYSSRRFMAWQRAHHFTSYREKLKIPFGRGRRKKTSRGIHISTIFFLDTRRVTALFLQSIHLNWTRTRRPGARWPPMSSVLVPDHVPMHLYSYKKNQRRVVDGVRLSLPTCFPPAPLLALSIKTLVGICCLPNNKRLLLLCCAPSAGKARNEHARTCAWLRRGRLRPAAARRRPWPAPAAA